MASHESKCPAENHCSEVNLVLRRLPQLSVLCVLLLAVAFICSPVLAADASEEQVETVSMRARDREYSDVLAEWRAAGYQDVEGVKIRIPGAAGRSPDGTLGDALTITSLGGRDDVLLQNGDDSIVVYEFEVPKSGLYQVELEFYLPEGKGSFARRAVQVDGETPFGALRRVDFYRMWRDSRRVPEKDLNGDDRRPSQVQIFGWQSKLLQDGEAMYREAFRFYFEAGKHTISFQQKREPLGIGAVIIKSPVNVPTYEELAKEYEAKGYQPAGDVYVKIQAEHCDLKSDPTIRREYGSDPLSEPRTPGQLRLNEFGSWRWRLPNQWAEWEFEVPQDGLYHISVRNWQGWNRIGSPREVRIDGKVPFDEMREYVFKYDRHWKRSTLGPEEGEPYFFYLTKGKHTLRMTNKLGAIAWTLRVLQEVQYDISELARDVVRITGAQPDPNMQWDLAKIMPDLIPRLNDLIDRLNEQVEYLEGLSEERPAVVNSILMTVAQLESMRKYPDSIPQRLEQLSQTQAGLGNWTLTLRELPVALDYIEFHGPDAELPRARSTFLERLSLTWFNFRQSFEKDYTVVGGQIAEAEDVIEVWVNRGRDWATVIKEMADDSFTPNTGIRLNMLLIPAGNQFALLLAAVAGKAPDVAIGVPSIQPVEFAIRNAVYDLSKFPDYEEVTKRFRPGALIPYQYEGGHYALPENQDFSMLFYRTDIMAELGYGDPNTYEINAPQTWQQVYEIVPKLETQNMEFWYGRPPTVQAVGRSAGLTPFLYQHGGSYYTPGGYRSALDTPEALAAFTEWTQLYTHYRMPPTANFYMRMRTGEIPIGIASYWTYVLLSTAAPELTGWWSMEPMPGHRVPDAVVAKRPSGKYFVDFRGGDPGMPFYTDGEYSSLEEILTRFSALQWSEPGADSDPDVVKIGKGRIDRSTGGLAQVCMILEDSRKREMAWEFIKWWTSKDPQVRFGSEIQALIGVEAMWNSANVNALRELPWPKKDIEAILSQWQWFREMPIVLGGYYTSRHVNNAWNRVVLEGWHPRDALEEAVKDINAELIRKQAEFGIFVDPKTGEVTRIGGGRGAARGDSE